jgi:hypothetical protein
MRIKLIEELPMATSAELYQLSWVIDQLLADPRRIVQARTQLHRHHTGIGSSIGCDDSKWKRFGWRAKICVASINHACGKAV